MDPCEAMLTERVGQSRRAGPTPPFERGTQTRGIHCFYDYSTIRTYCVHTDEE